MSGSNISTVLRIKKGFVLAEHNWRGDIYMLDSMVCYL
jgi:hypothetical protein